MPLPRLAEETSCPYCDAPNEVSRGLWVDIVTMADRMSAEGSIAERKRHEGAREVFYTVEAGAPACDACKEPLPVEALEVGVSRNFACTSCGDPASTEAVPYWVPRFVASARQLYFADPKGTLAGDVALGSVEKAVKPIAMACPRCGGGLELTAASERLLACEYCRAEVYIPDGLWRRLHPLKQMQPFYVRFEGPCVAPKLW